MTSPTERRPCRSASDLHPFVSFSSHQQVKSSLRLLFSLLFGYSLFLFFAPSVLTRGVTPRQPKLHTLVQYQVYQAGSGSGTDAILHKSVHHQNDF